VRPVGPVMGPVAALLAVGAAVAAFNVGISNTSAAMIRAVAARPNTRVMARMALPPFFAATTHNRMTVTMRARVPPAAHAVPAWEGVFTNAAVAELDMGRGAGHQ
jgi:hypothetical protein